MVEPAGSKPSATQQRVDVEDRACQHRAGSASGSAHHAGRLEGRRCAASRSSRCLRSRDVQPRHPGKRQVQPHRHGSGKAHPDAVRWHQLQLRGDGNPLPRRAVRTRTENLRQAQAGWATALGAGPRRSIDAGRPAQRATAPSWVWSASSGSTPTRTAAASPESGLRPSTRSTHTSRAFAGPRGKMAAPWR